MQGSSTPTTKFPEITDIFVDELAKKAGKGKKIDGRGAMDMPAILGGFEIRKTRTAREPGAANVVTNNVANGLLKDPGAIKVFLSTWNNFVFSCTGAQRWEKLWSRYPSSFTWSPMPRK